MRKLGATLKNEMKKQAISIIIPIFNESAVLHTFHNRLNLVTNKLTNNKFNNANLLLLDVLFVDYGTLKDQSVWEDA